jgi:hypothetical protein
VDARGNVLPSCVVDAPLCRAGCWVDAGLAGCCLRLGGFAGSYLCLGCLSLACCAVVVWLASLGRLDERARIMRGGMASYCMVGMALAGAGGAGGWLRSASLV